MKLAYYIKEEKLALIPGIPDLTGKIRATGAELYRVKFPEDVVPGTDALLSLGGDGTFLSAARIAVPSGLPVLGVNFGRLGFLSDMEPGALVDALQKWEFVTEERDLLRAGASFVDDADFWPYALNEVSVSRTGASMLGIDVSVDGVSLPTYWADGLLVATGTGSTAYSLSAGGPICTPDARVFILSPISPHNLNLRPLLIPNTSSLEIRLRSRDDKAVFTMDNRIFTIPKDSSLTVELAPVRLKRLCLGRGSFFNALRNRLFWGEDMRNSNVTY